MHTGLTYHHDDIDDVTFVIMAHICKRGNVKKGNSKTVKCGSCLNVFRTICLLHEHLSGMSYTYTHTDGTCYPLFDFKCKTVKPKVLTLKKSTAVQRECQATEASVETPLISPSVEDNGGDYSGCTEMKVTEVNVPIMDQGSKQLVKCDICDLVLQRANLKKHALRHLGARSFVCERCAKSFVTSSELKKHVLCIHERENIDNQYTCEKCSQKFVSKFLLHKHIEKHGNRRFKCHFCLKDFTWGRSLKLHVAKEHDSSYTPQFACYICSERWSTKRELEEHKRAKHSEPTLPCSHCLRLFKDKCSLKRHMKTHTGARMYRCDDCSHGFIQINPYYTHMLKRHGIAKHDAYSLHLRMKDKHFDEQSPPTVQEVHTDHSYPQEENVEVDNHSQYHVAVQGQLENEIVQVHQHSKNDKTRLHHGYPQDVDTDVGNVTKHRFDTSQEHMKSRVVDSAEKAASKPYPAQITRPEIVYHHQQVGHITAESQMEVPHHVVATPTYMEDNTQIVYQVETGIEVTPVETRYVEVNNEPIQICLENGEQINEIRIINV